MILWELIQKGSELVEVSERAFERSMSLTTGEEPVGEEELGGLGVLEELRFWEARFRVLVVNELGV